MGWSGRLATLTRRGTRDAFTMDFVAGRHGRFLIAVTPGDSLYDFTLTVGDGGAPRGPFDIAVNGEPVVRGVTTAAGEFRAVAGRARAPRGVIEWSFDADSCATFAVCGLQLAGPPGAELARLSAMAAGGLTIPPPDSLTVLRPGDYLPQIERWCDFLMHERPGEGGFSPVGAWYQDAYAVRALMAASRLTNRADWRDAALERLDRFVAAQRPDGNWLTRYLPEPPCGTTPDTTSANLADIGVMTQTLIIGAAQADSSRRVRYLESARRYVDQVTRPWQLPDGSFPNGRWEGNEHLHPYTVATATQAGTLLLLAAAEGRPEDREAGDRAMTWLASSIEPDGLMAFHAHNLPGVARRDPRAFGESYYVIEALAIGQRYVRDPAVRGKITAALDRLIAGPAGLRSTAVHDYWWSPVPFDLWGASKMPGLPGVLSMMDDAGTAAWRTAALPRMAAWLADPALGRAIGVGAPGASETGEYSLFATSLASLSLSAMIDPTSVIPWPGQRIWAIDAPGPRRGYPTKRG